MDTFLFQNLVGLGELPADGPQNLQRAAAYLASVWLGYPHEDVPPCHFSDYLCLRGWDKEKLKNGLWRAAHADNANRSDDECAIAALKVVQSWLTFGFLESVFESRIPVETYTQKVEIASNTCMQMMWTAAGNQLLPPFYGQPKFSQPLEVPMFNTRNLVPCLVSLSSKHQHDHDLGAGPGTYAQRLNDAFIELSRALQSLNSIDIYKGDSVSGPLFRGPGAKVRAFLHDIVMRDGGPNSMVNSQDPDTSVGSVFPWTLMFPALLGGTVQLHFSSLIPDVEITEPRLPTNLIMKKLVFGSQWCPYTLERLRVTTQYTVLYWLWASGFEDLSSKSHSECNEKSCNAYRIPNESLYPTWHVNECKGNCMTFYLNMHKIRTVYNSGKFPVITVTHSLDPSLPIPYLFDVGSIDPLDPSATPYTAFSHVWADGFGSTTEQGMPMCQVEFLADAIFSINDAKQESTSFWIDSLCIPSDKGLRKDAILLMTNVYKSARSVLVLDRTLQKCSIKLSAEELLLRIYTSPWMTRVWTYQEGVLAAKLYFNLSDDNCLLDFSTKELDVAGPLHIPKPHDQTRDVYRNLRTQLQNLDRAAGATNISCLINEIRWRDTLYRDPNGKNDELIAAGVLLGLDMSHLLEAEGEQRMKRFLLAVKTLPREIIFSHVERLTLDGFRWAPSTFLVQDDRRLSTDLAPSKNKSVECTASGLLGRYLVFRIAASRPVHGIMPGEKRTVVERRSRRWFEVATMDDNKMAWGFDHIIVLPEGLPESTHGTVFVGVAALAETATDHALETREIVAHHAVDLVCTHQRIVCLFNLRELQSGLDFDLQLWPGLVEGRFERMTILLR